MRFVASQTVEAIHWYDKSGVLMHNAHKNILDSDAVSIQHTVV